MENQLTRRRPLPDRDLDYIDRASRLFLLPAVIAVSAALVAAGLYPMIGGAGRVIKRFDDQFLGGKSVSFRIPDFPERSTIYAADGSVLAELFLDENRKVVALSEVNEVTRRAVLAIEDHNFYLHGPVDLSSIVRAAIANLEAHRIVQGGSTITQQLVKNINTGPARTFARKWREAQEAIRLEQRYSKDRIFELYLNEIYFGHRAYGIGAAAEYYFNRTPADLTLPQAALLAGMISAPATTDPIDHPDVALVRRNAVLAHMLKYRWITQADYDKAVITPIKLSRRGRTANTAGPEPYWVSFVVRQFESDPRFGKTVEDRKKLLFQGGLRVYTTLQRKLQKTARRVMSTHLPNSGPKPPADPQAAVVSIVPQTGAIRVMVGGKDFSKQQIDLASQGARSTGSAFKAFTLAAAMEENVPAERVYSSGSPVTIPECQAGGWTVNNAEPGTGGRMSLWEATADSVNVVFAQLIRDVGPAKVAAVAKEMGLQGYVPPFCAITLGAVAVSPLSMTSAYSTLANNGIHCKPYAIAKVVIRTGQTLKTKPQCRRVVPARVAAQVTAMLRGVIDHGTGTRAQIGRPEAGKTGTGQDYQDAWFMGYVPQVCTGVWVGFSKGEISMRDLPVLGGANAFGGTIAAPIWHDFMLAAVAGLAPRDFPPPPAPKKGTVPDVVGLKQEDAKSILANANFVPVVKEVNSKKPAGIVVGQSPPGGYVVTLGTDVVIQVSNGKPPKPAKALVPNVVGAPVNQARAALQSAGFRVAIQYQVVSDKSLDGIVLAQQPPPGSRRPEGSTVTIVVGRFK